MKHFNPVLPTFAEVTYETRCHPVYLLVQLVVILLLTVTVDEECDLDVTGPS